MEFCLVTLLWYCIVFYLLVHLVWFIFADADFTLLWATVTGHSPETRLKGLVVWVTGASSGIGEELSYQLAKCGSRLILSARREDELNRVKRRCLEVSSLQDGDILVLPLDLVERTSHAEKANAVIQHFGQIDVLINNGGRSQLGLFVETNVDVYDALMELNFLGTVSITKQVLPLMIQRGRGSIVTVSSMGGLFGFPLLAGYNASKHALQGFFNSLRIELSEYPDIHIGTVCPGPVVSQIHLNALSEELDKLSVPKTKEPPKMPTSRCGRLILVGIVNGLQEMWIGQQPFLLLFYLWQYTPKLAGFITSKLGRIIVANFKAGLKTDNSTKTKTH